MTPPDSRLSLFAARLALAAAGIAFADLHTTQRSLEDIFVSLVSEREPVGEGAR